MNWINKLLETCTEYCKFSNLVERVHFSQGRKREKKEMEEGRVGRERKMEILEIIIIEF